MSCVIVCNLAKKQHSVLKQFFIKSVKVHTNIFH